MSTSKKGGAAVGEEVVRRLPGMVRRTNPAAWNPGSKSASEIRIQHAKAQDLLNAWDCDLWHLSQSPINPDLKPLTAEELEGLVTRFPDVMSHIYVRHDAVLFETAATEPALMEVLRRDLVLTGEVQIHVHARGGFDISEWCGGDGGTVHVLTFNTLRVCAIHQTLAPVPCRS